MALYIALILTLVPLAANAWSALGHKTAALIAESRLTPAAKAEVTRLLDLEPGESLASLSLWADEHRNPTTAAWHFMNFPRDSCRYDASRDCPDGKCVVGAIERQAAVLGSDAPDEQRFLALKYLFHFVPDVHQPLHSGYADDKGGNKYQLQLNGRGSNLHRVWDVDIIKHVGSTYEELIAAMDVGSKKTPSAATDSAPVESVSAARMAEESCQIVGANGFYPGRQVDSGYLEKFAPVALERLRLSGLRLADLVNRFLR